MNEKGGITFFRREFFVSQCRKISWASLQCFRKFGVPKNFMHTRGYDVFPSKIFGLSARKFRGHPFNVSENLGYRKFLCIIGGITIFRREFLVSQCRKKFRGHPFNASENLRYRKSLCILGGTTFFRRKFLVSQCRKNSWASLQCLRKFGVSKKLMHNRGCHNFPSKIFCLTVPKNFVGIPTVFEKTFGFKNHSAEKFRGHPFNASENLGYRKILCILGGITFFRRKFLVSQCQKISWASLQCFRKIGVSKIFMHIRVYHNFPSRIFDLTVPEKISWASLQCFRKFEVPKNFMHTRGYHVFPSKIFGLTVPKKFVGIPSMSQKIWGIEKIYA